MKNFVTKFLIVLWGISFTSSTFVAFAEDEVIENQILIEVFEREECQHCQDLREYLGELSDERDDFFVNYYDLAEEENYQLWEEFVELEGLTKSTPIVLIGDNIINGFDSGETTGLYIEDLLDSGSFEENVSFSEFIALGGSGKVENTGSGCEEDSEGCVVEFDEEPFYVKIPFVGSVDVKQYSLPTMSVILGFIDGFNPCAMWVLVTFLLVLVQVGDKKKMWQIAGLFILAETVMYYLILNVWLTVWDFVGLDNIITPIVGIVAIGGGIFFLYEWKTSDGTCKVTNLKQRSKTKKKISKIVEAEMTFLTVLAILGLALSVNIIEFACSIGIPQTFTKILDLNVLSFWKQQFYMLLYILFYMIDDFLVFGIALYGIEKIGMTQKYSKWCNLIGGLLMLILGAILIFGPELLVF